MKYELEELEEIVAELTGDISFISDDIQTTPARSADQLLLITRNIKTAFREIAFGDYKEVLVERYFQNHQAALIDLADQLWDQIIADDLNDSLGDSNSELLIVYNQLDQLIIYLEKHFSQYFNPENRIPNSYRQIALREIQDQVTQIQQVLSDDQLDPNLIRLLLAPINMLKDQKEDVTFNFMIFTKALVNEVQSLIAQEINSSDLTDKILMAMIYINYNSYKFFAYCVDFITSRYQQADTLNGQLEQLAWYSKSISQAPIKPGYHFRCNRPSLKDQLLEWITDESNFLEKRHQLSINMAFSQQVHPEDSPKINLNFSVAQIAYFIRLLVESKIIGNRNQMEVLRFFANHAMSKKAETISLESLRTKYYNVDNSTIITVRESIIALLNHSRKP